MKSEAIMAGASSVRLGLNAQKSAIAMNTGLSMSTHPSRLETAGPHFGEYIMPYPAVMRSNAKNTMTASAPIVYIT